MDPYKFLKIGRNPDGSLTRFNALPLSPPSEGGSGSTPAAVLSKDVPLNPAHKTWLRIYSPQSIPDHEKLPILLYFHGGGFVLFSAATVFIHDSCSRMASELPALILSVEYRLAPEHPLPAAYEDAVDAVLWIRQQAVAAENEADPWVRGHGDFSRCFLMGDSSGGNIAYHAGLRAAAMDLRPLHLAGLILNQPYFGGEERTESELRSGEDRIIPLPANDLMWQLSLPAGADRDHEFCNPMLHHNQRPEGKELPWCLVRGYVGDPLIDRQRELAKMLERRAAGVVGRLEEEGHHAIELFDRAKADAMLSDVKNFLYPPSPNAAAASGCGVRLDGDGGGGDSFVASKF